MYSKLFNTRNETRLNVNESCIKVLTLLCFGAAFLIRDELWCSSVASEKEGTGFNSRARWAFCVQFTYSPCVGSPLVAGFLPKSKTCILG